MDGLLINVIHWITRAIEVTGTGMIVIGAAAALFRFLAQVFKGLLDEQAVGGFRSNLGTQFCWVSNSSSHRTSSTRLPSSPPSRASQS